MNQSCNSIRQLLSEQRDRPLTTTEQATLHDHLASCAGCRAFDRDLHTGMAGIARLPRVSGSAEVREAVLAGVHPGGRSAWPRGWRDWTGQALKIGGAVTAFALVALLLMTVFDTSGTGEPDERLSGTGSQPGAVEEPTTTVAVLVPPLCGPGQFALEVETTEHPADPASNDPGSVAIVVQAGKSTGGAQCRLQIPVSLSLTDASGMPLPIEGNPAIGEIDTILGPDVGSVAFPWLNWCGEDGSFNLKVELPTSSNSATGITESLDVTPPCVDASAPSLLGMAAIEAWMLPVETDTDGGVSSCSGRSNIIIEPEPNADGSLQIWYVTAEEGDCGDPGDVVTIRLEDQAGGLLDIEGNTTDLTLTPHESGSYMWAGVRWTNWCGERAYINLQFAQPSSGMGTGTEEMPSCVDASQPSQLTALDSPPTGDPWQGAPAPGQIVPTPGMMSEPPVCDPTTLHLKLLPVPSPGHYVGIDGKTSGGGDAEFCVVDAAEMTVTITDPNGQLLPVDRNGETIPYDWQGSNGFVWDNWCGEDGPFTITVTIAGQTLELEVANGPECTHEEEPSAIWGPADTRTRGP